MLWLLKTIERDLSRIGCVKPDSITLQNNSLLEFVVTGLNCSAWTEITVLDRGDVTISTPLYTINHRRLFTSLDHFYWKLFEMNFKLPPYGKFSENPGTGELTWQTGFSAFEYHEKVLRIRLEATSNVIDYYYLAIAALDRGIFDDDSPLGPVVEPPQLTGGETIDSRLLQDGRLFDLDAMRLIEELKNRNNSNIEEGEVVTISDDEENVEEEGTVINTDTDSSEDE